MKKCRTCLVEKSLDEFAINKRSPDGKVHQCKICAKEASRIWYSKNKEIARESQKRWLENNGEKHKEWMRQYQSVYMKKYQQEHRQEINDYRSKWHSSRRKTDPFYKMTINTRERLRKALKLKKWRKNSKFSKSIGCDKETFLAHIESLLKPGMSWENHGKWHLDHIIPISSANNEEELYALCHYLNLQPLWAIENLKKGSKIDSLR